MLNARYTKNNRVRFKSLKDREEGVKIFNEFFQNLRKKEKGIEMKGHIVLESLSDPKEAIVLTFWETRDVMDRFYSPENTILSNLVERVKPLFEKMPERTDYRVTELSM